MTLSPFEYPVDRVIREYSVVPALPVSEIVELWNSGLSVDEDGESIVDNADPDVPFGWSVIEADDNMIISPENM